MILQNVVKGIRLWLLEKVENSLHTDARVLDQINLEQAQLANWLRNTYQNYKIKLVTYSKNTTGIYVLPFDVVDILSLRLVDSTGLSQPVEISKIISGKGYYDGYYVETNNLIVKILNSFNNYDRLELRYYPWYAYVTYGAVQWIAANKIKITDGSMAFDDIYNEYYIDIFGGEYLSGQQSGYYSYGGALVPAMGPGYERFTIIDYDGPNRIVTLDRDMKIVVGAATEYSVISPIPEEHHELLILGGAMRLFQADNDRAPDNLMIAYNDRLGKFMKDIDERIESDNRSVPVMDENDYNF